MSRRKTVYQRIMTAARDGRCLRLSPDDVITLARDDAISECADNDEAGGCWTDTPDGAVWRSYNRKAKP